jgi:protease-4
MYGRFLTIVAEARHKSPQQVDQIAQGRVWDGGTAHQLGLVDGFGGIDEAVAKAAQLAGLGNERRVRYLEPPVSFRQELIEAIANEQGDNTAVPQDAFASFARAPQQQLAAMLNEIHSILAGPSIQARCLECRQAAPVRLDKRDLSLLALLKGWLS